ncbi:MAG: ferrochelatase [Nocardioidaceae bacterium]
MSPLPPPSRDVRPYDAVLLVSFGGPEQPADVLPFLANVTHGRGIGQQRLREVAEHYESFGGRSPINDQCRHLLSAIREDLRAAGIGLPVYWGNRNWDPYLSGAVARMAADGVRRAACFVTSAYPSYSGCRQYRENLFDAVIAVDATGSSAPRLDKLRHYHDHPGFVQPFVDAAVTALDDLPADRRDPAQLIFVTHSIPQGMAADSGRFPGPGGDGHAYVATHRAVAAEVSRRVAAATGRRHPHSLAYCSRSGPAHVLWLEPDVNDHLGALHRAGARAVVVVPIGFVSDHMEVVFDLDTEAAATARRLGLAFARAATPGTDPRFVAMVRDLLLERAAAERAEQPVRTTVGGRRASWDVCPAGCCRNGREPDRPALCGADTLYPVQMAPR